MNNTHSTKLLTFALLAAAPAVVHADNPIIPDQGVCDPHIHIFGDRAYLFSSHDYGTGEPKYKMTDWQLFSSADLVNWRKEFVLKPEDTFIGPRNECYAPDGATRNGKYYFYFSQQQKQTGVAVSDKPGGPYIDALGKPLLPRDLTTSAEYDPAVFTDDDAAKTPYIIWGYTVQNEFYYIAKLNDDMISLAEAPRKIEFEGKGWRNDAPFVHKRGGLYYLNSHGSNYATSTDIYGPYTYRGKFSKDAFVDHGGFFDWHNQNFFTYGVPNNWGKGVADRHYRTTKISIIHYKDNGDIVNEPFIEQSALGVGQYDANWQRTQAEWYYAASDGTKKREGGSRFVVRDIANGSALGFPKFHNVPANATLTFQASSENPKGGKIEVREGGAGGKLLGSCKVSATGSWSVYQPFKVKLKNSAGLKDLHLIFKGADRSELMRLDWFTFGDYQRYEAEKADISRPAAVAANHTGYSGAGFVAGFDATGGATVTFKVKSSSAGNARIALSYSCGAGAQTIGLYANGKKIKDLDLPATNDWSSWSTVEAEVPLAAGDNTIAFVTEKPSPLNIDHLDVLQR